MFEDRIIDSRVRESVFPVRLCAVAGAVEHAEILLERTDLQIGLSEQCLVAVNGRGFIVLDFGKEMNASVRILTQVIDGGECRIRIRTGESLSETYAEIGEKNAGNHHTLRDVTVTLPMYSDMEFLQTGFRFVRIDFPEEKRVFLKAVVAVSIHRDLHPVGGFVCDDERVNEIFSVASRTLMLSMQTYIWDGIKRDRLVWIGDMHPESMGIACLFGQDSTVERSLDYVRDHTPLPGWMNNIPTYTAWWLIILHDYFEQNANLSYLEEQRDYIRGALSLLNGVVNEDGTIAVDDSFLFDWPSHGSEDEKVGLYAIWVLAGRKSRRLLHILGEDTSVCDDMLGRLSRNRNTAVSEWKQCEAFLVYAGLKPAGEAHAFLTKGGANGFSTFMSYYLLCAIADGGGAAEAVSLMKEYYGAMLDLGATTFWEDFDLKWKEGSAPLDRLPQEGEHDIHGDFGKHCYVGFRHSFCHGWSCGPIAFLMRRIGGIEILEPGCKKVRIRPEAAGFRFYELTYPTPYGPIRISLRDGKTTVSVPEGVTLAD